ncbi:MAG: hypothetical protein HYR76_01770, partial [Ignavibacteria bacterium]|nr:hypothetical protein [Ignavibacteria bacterium]
NADLAYATASVGSVVKDNENFDEINVGWAERRGMPVTQNKKSGRWTDRILKMT